MKYLPGFDTACTCSGTNGLGADSPEAIDTLVRNTVAVARDLFPGQTAAAEEWIAARLMSYGTDYAKYKVQQGYGVASEWLSNPFVVLGIGLFAGWIIFKRS